MLEGREKHRQDTDGYEHTQGYVISQVRFFWVWFARVVAMTAQERPSEGTGAEQKLRDAAKALAEAAGQLGQSLGAAGSAQAESGVAKGLFAAAEALAQAKSWVEQRAKPLSTREQLLRSAAELFADRGYAGVSLEDIAQAAGFTKGAVYSHFGSKEQVFLAAVRRVAEQAAADADPAPAWGITELSSATKLTLEALLFGVRNRAHQDEVREITAALISAVPRLELRLAEPEFAADPAAETPQPAVADGRELSRDELDFAGLSLRTLLGELGGLSREEDAATGSG